MKPNFNIPIYDQAHYTKGGEYSLDLKEYIGEYHFRGQDAWTESVPSISSKRLGTYSTSIGVMEYDLLRPDIEKVKKYLDPAVTFPNPSERDYEIGFISRYFVKDRTSNAPLILEIDNIQANKYGQVFGIDPNKYMLGNVTWYISLKEVTVDRISLANSKSLYTFNKSMPGIIEYLPNTFELSYLIV